MPLAFKKPITSIVPLYKKSLVPLLTHSNFFIGANLWRNYEQPSWGLAATYMENNKAV
jgi:hypothetical protein